MEGKIFLIVLCWTMLGPVGSESLGPVLPEMKSGETLHDFLHRVVVPDQQFVENCDAIINHLNELLQQDGGPLTHKRWTVQRVKKVGSYGKGTAVNLLSDMDIMVIFGGVKDIGDLASHVGEVMGIMKDYLEAKQTFAREFNFYRILPMALQFKLQIPDSERTYGVDIIPSVDLLAMGHTPSSIYKAVEDEGEMSQTLMYMYQGALKSLNIQFVKAAPQNVIRVIQLVKYWKETNDVPIASSAVELIVIWLWRQDGRPEVFNLSEYFIRTLQQLAHVDTMGISFDDSYDFTDYSPNLKKPYLLDPSNPFSNMLPSAKSLEVIKRSAFSALKVLDLKTVY